MLTFSDCKASLELTNVSGVCATSEQFRSYLNAGVRKLMNRGNFWSTVVNMQGCVFGSCITWPRYVGTVLAVNSCAGHIPIKNQWYSFSPIDGNAIRSHFQHNCCGSVTVRDDNNSPVFNQIPCNTDVYLRFYCMDVTDVGKHITIFGVDGNGQTIRSQRTDGTYQDGVVLTLAIPYVQTSFTVRNVTRVLKEQTNFPVHGYQVNVLDSTLTELAHYDASETRPDYRTSRILSGCRTGSCHGSTVGDNTQRIDSLVKMQWVAVQFDDDLVQIDNLDALGLAIQSARYSDQGDDAEAEGKMARAVHELNLEMRNKMPNDQIPVNVSPYGVAHLAKRNIGAMM